MALVTVTDLREYMSGISLSANQMRTAQAVLDGTQQALEIYLNRPVQPVQVREKRRATDTGFLALSATPVYSVISLRVLGAEESATLPDKDVTALSPEEADRVWDAMSEDNMIAPGGIDVGRSGWYVVEYVGGYNGYFDDALKLAILEVASRTMTVEHDDTLTIKADMAREPASSPPIVKGWKAEELQLFDRLRRRTVYS